MPYITVPQSPIYHQITLDELLSGNTVQGLIRSNESNTRTYYTKNDGSALFDDERVLGIIYKLRIFVENHRELYEVNDMHELYNTFKIPKKTGGLRTINAPVDSLMDALNELKSIFENDCLALYHTSAFAYVKKRSTVDAVKRHQSNNSHWFMKTDFHDFFGSTTKEFVMHTINDIVPFNLIMQYETGYNALSKALDLAFLDGGLPQGTPISPMLTNLIMIPFDFKISNALRDFNNQQFIYTRYADDTLISSLRDFKPAEIEELITSTLRECNAPYTFKKEKTRYGSRAGSNWNLGVMLNKDNEITVGHKAKKHFRAMLTNYILDNKNSVKWDISDVQSMAGLLSYYKMIEKDYFDELIEKINNKHNVNVSAMIKADLSI